MRRSISPISAIAPLSGCASTGQLSINIEATDFSLDPAIFRAKKTLETVNPSLPQLSVVIPVYNESGNLQPLIEEIENTLAHRMRFEVVIVDDGSIDSTAAEAADLAHQRPWLRVETHEHNRGQSAAIHRGVQSSRAPIIAVLDGDGQNDPADIPTLFAVLYLTGDAMAVGERRTRRDTWNRRISSRIANKFRASLLHDGIADTGCGLKVFNRADFLQLPAFDHMHRFLPVLMQNRGHRVRSVPVNHRSRRHGRSKYGINNRLWTGMVDLLGVMWLQRRRL